jgi:PhoH-like ATPase
MNEVYTGYKELTLTEDQACQMYNEGRIDDYEFIENEYLLAKNDEGEVFERMVSRDGKLQRVPYQSLDNHYLGRIKPRNDQQQLVIDTLLHPDSKIKLIKGVYGSGKDYLMLAAALQLIEKKKFDKLIFLRPNVGVKGLPDIGALPGTADEKLAWTLAPLSDKVGGQEGIEFMIHNKILEAVPILFIRGRSFENSIIYMTEGQNMTTEIAKLVIGRIGEGSEFWCNADNSQTDRKIFDDDNGVNRMIERLKGNKLFSYVYMPKTERSEVAELATLLSDPC